MIEREIIPARTQSKFGFMGELSGIENQVRVGIVGVTGIIGEQLLKILKERSFPLGDLRVFASSNSQSTVIATPFGVLPVEKLNLRKISDFDIVFMAAGSKVARSWGLKFARRGALVIDKSSYFRHKSYARLTVPEVNPEALQTGAKIFANPNCATIPIVHALKPLHDHFVLKSFTAVTFQSVTGAGRRGVQSYENELKNPKAESSHFSERIVDNVIPWIGDSVDSRSGEEKKIVRESRKILQLPRLPIRATCVRIPVRTGHCVAIHADFQKSVDVDKARILLKEFPGIALIDNPQEQKFPTALKSLEKDKIYVGRVRRDRNNRGLALWVAVDNLRKGAAVNAVQIAQLLVQHIKK